MIPDNQLFHTVVQGGSFAVLVLILIWGIFRMEPRIRETMERKDAEHGNTVRSVTTEASTVQKQSVQQFSEAVAKMNADNASLVKQIMTENRTLIDAIVKRHDEQVLRITQECKEERKEWSDTLVREMEANRDRTEKEGELNRKSRNEFAGQIRQAMSEVLEQGEERGVEKERGRQRLKTGSDRE